MNAPRALLLSVVLLVAAGCAGDETTSDIFGESNAALSGVEESSPTADSGESVP